ncbi:hypothetical protein P9112_010612 [Eukaryota sp. TZLM1-RC]
MSFLEDLITGVFVQDNDGLRSRWVLDGRAIHRAPALETALVHQCGIKYVIVPPYTPEHNPIKSFFKQLRNRVVAESHHRPPKTLANTIQILHSVLLNMKFDCKPIFDRSGWYHWEYFKSPYLNSERFVSQAVFSRD